LTVANTAYPQQNPVSGEVSFVGIKID
jgi:hypothetical protein